MYSGYICQIMGAYRESNSEQDIEIIFQNLNLARTLMPCAGTVNSKSHFPLDDTIVTSPYDV